MVRYFPFSVICYLYINNIKERAVNVLPSFSCIYCRWWSQQCACDVMATDFVLNIKS